MKQIHSERIFVVFCALLLLTGCTADEAPLTSPVNPSESETVTVAPNPNTPVASEPPTPTQRIFPTPVPSDAAFATVIDELSDVGERPELDNENVVYLGQIRRDASLALSDAGANDEWEVFESTNDHVVEFFTDTIHVQTGSIDEPGVYYIRVCDSACKTSSGLRIYDGIECITELYGADYDIFFEESAWFGEFGERFDIQIYEYKIGDHYFWVETCEDRVVGFVLSKYEYQRYHPQLKEDVTVDEFADKPQGVENTIYLGTPRREAFLTVLAPVWESEEWDGFEMGWDENNVPGTISGDSDSVDFVPGTHGNVSLAYITDGNFTLTRISAYGDAIPTTLGFRVGDTVERMKELYGDEYVKTTGALPGGRMENAAAYEHYEYKIGEHYFRVMAKESVVIQWHVSLYSVLT